MRDETFAREGSWLGGFATLALVLAPAAAQTPLLIVNVPTPTLGVDADAVGDWDGDGCGDLAVGIPGPYSISGTPGTVRIVSGLDGSLLAQLEGATPMQRFGAFVAGLGDLDADGAIDLAVGSLPSYYFDLKPSLQVFSGASGTPLFEYSYPTFGLLALARAGDVNADGHADVVKGGQECPGGFGTMSPGDATVYSGATGAVLHVWCGDGSGDGFGNCLAAAGDMNADSYSDIVVGANEGEDYTPKATGYVRALSGIDGATIHTWEGPPSVNNGFGETVDGAGDVDGDGYPDIVAGARQEKVDGVYFGSASVFSGRDGSLLHHVLGQIPYVQFGFKVAGPGDVDSDGLADFAVGTAQLELPGAPQVGYQVYSGADASLLHVVPMQAGATEFLMVLRAAGDINVDGTPDLLAVANDFTVSSVRLHSGAQVLFSDLGFALSGSRGTPHLEIEGVLTRGLPLELRVSAAPPLAPLFLVLGGAAAPVALHGGVLVPTPQVLVAGLVTEASGLLSLQTTLGTSLPTGIQVVVQGWLPDAGAVEGWAATNAVLGVAP